MPGELLRDTAMKLLSAMFSITAKVLDAVDVMRVGHEFALPGSFRFSSLAPSEICLTTLAAKKSGKLIQRSASYTLTRFFASVPRPIRFAKDRKLCTRSHSTPKGWMSFVGSPQHIDTFPTFCAKLIILELLLSDAVRLDSNRVSVRLAKI